MDKLLWKRSEPHHLGIYKAGFFTIRRISEVSSGKKQIWKLELDAPSLSTVKEAKLLAEELVR